MLLCGNLSNYRFLCILKSKIKRGHFEKCLAFGVFCVPFHTLSFSEVPKKVCQQRMILVCCPPSVLDQVSVSVCFDTSEVRDVVVLLQHGQGGRVQVIGQACTAHCWCWRVLATTHTTTPFSPT